jgi:O-antigen/teichoic acid export membrane protein
VSKPATITTPVPTGHRDGLALALSSVLGSLAGFVSWLIAARIMTPAQVGDAQLVVSAFLLVGGAAQLNLDVGLMRWIPGAGPRTSGLIGRSLLVIMPLAGLLGLAYALAAPRIGAVTAGPDAPVAVGVLLFVVACAGWSAFAVHDAVLVALARPWWAVWRNGLFAAVRIALLVLLGGIAGLGAWGVVLSWIGPVIGWIAVGTVVVAVLAARAGRSGRPGALPDRGEVVGFLGPTALGHFAAALLYNQVPLLVNLRFGADTGAVFFIAWQAVMVVDLAATYFMAPLAGGIAREPHRAVELAAAARRRLLLIFVPVLVAGALVAEPVLGIFGDAYAQADDVLRVLLLGLVFRLVVVHELGVRQASGRAMAFARLQIVSTALVLVAAAAVPVSAAGVVALMPVAVGYVAVQVACAVAVLFFPGRHRATTGEVRP